MTTPPHRIVALARSLLTSHGRKKTGQVLLEGVRAAEALAASPVKVTAVLVTAAARQEDRTARVVAALQMRGAPVHETPAALLRSLSQVETPQGLLVLCAVPRVDLSDVLAHPFVVIVDRVQDPGNLGTVLRLARAFGVGGVVTTWETVEVANPKTVRAAAGAWPGLPVAESVDSAALVAALRASGHRMIVADARGEALMSSTNWTGQVALVLGSEGHGAGEALVRGAGTRVRIPLAAGVESLNVASAGAILLAEAARRRGFPSH
jgi:TrmH family RNA methyltransferase